MCMAHAHIAHKAVTRAHNTYAYKHAGIHKYLHKHAQGTLTPVRTIFVKVTSPPVTGIGLLS